MRHSASLRTSGSRSAAPSTSTLSSATSLAYGEHAVEGARRNIRGRRSRIADHVALFGQGFILGALHSVNVLVMMAYCVRSKALLRTLRDCMVANGVLLTTVWLAVKLFSLVPLDPAGPTYTICASAFAVLWVIPVYLFTVILGVGWYETLYRTARQLKGLPSPTTVVSFFTVTDNIVKLITTIVFGVVAVLIGFVPLVGPLLSFLASAWLHAFYCFDYQFMDERNGSSADVNFALRLPEIFDRFEEQPGYYLGFGATHIALRLFIFEGYMGLSMVPSLAMCSLAYALNIIMTVDAVPPQKPFPVKFPIFSPFLRMVLQFIRPRKRTQSSNEVEPKESTEVDSESGVAVAGRPQRASQLARLQDEDDWSFKHEWRDD